MQNIQKQTHRGQKKRDGDAEMRIVQNKHRKSKPPNSALLKCGGQRYADEVGGYTEGRGVISIQLNWKNQRGVGDKEQKAPICSAFLIPHSAFSSIQHS